MQVNLNTNINQSRPNFKAGFSDDVGTKILLNSFNRSNRGQINLLATHYALQDMSSNDKIGIIEKSYNTIYARNLTNGKEIRLNGYNRRRDVEELASELRDAIENGYLINEKPKFDIDVYVEKAIDFLESASKKENSAANKLQQQIKKLEDKLKILKDKLWEVNHNTKAERNTAVKREIFSSAKK